MRQRVITAFLLAVPVLYALAREEPLWLYVLGVVAAAIGGSEADRILETKRPLATTVSAFFFGFVAFSLLPQARQDFGAVSLLLTGATLMGVAGAVVPKEFPFGTALRSFAGLWVAAPLVCVLALHRSATGSPWVLSPALMALVPVWAGDIAAIFVGKAFGKRPLAPKISPKKTVEGSVANLLAAVLVAWLLGRLLHIDDTRALGAGLAAGTLGQAGDLFESWLKRRVGAKDSGTLLPGHGGVLDRIDSVLFAAPAVALILLS